MASAAGLSVLVAVIGLLGGCATGDAWSTPRTAAAAVGSVGAGFVDPSSTPDPASTIVPRAGSWDSISPPVGYRVVLLSAGDAAPTAALVAAVDQWAKDTRVDLRTVVAADDDDLVPAIVRAIDLHPDLVISAGDALVDPLALVTASHLDQQFLVVGAELAEPTLNVTAVDWAGASFRGEGLGTASTYDPASFTAVRCGAAVRAGAAAVLTGVTGIVIWVD
ncbi:MAG: hypothetical protein KJ792_01335 [Actinobacteria bacterium]|nr:hypothetical protein [Actinomycetota bacterium]